MRNHFFEMGMLTILLWIAQLQHQAIVVAAWVVVPSSPLDKSQTLRDGTRLFMIPVEDLGNTKQANATMAPVLTPKEGDRVLVDQNEETVATPGFPQENPHNFGPASSRDSTVYTCERPGGDPSNPDSKIPTQAVVDAWVQFMTSSENQIRHVVILLRDAELEAYEDPGLIAAYEAAGIVVHHIPFASDDSYKRIMTVIDEIESKGERVVAHCTHGMGRSGRVAAGWLVHKYGVSAEQAVEDSLEAAREHKVERLGAPRQLREWMGI